MKSFFLKGTPVFLLAAFLLGGVGFAQDDYFTLECKLPYQGKPREIDGQCNHEGQIDSDVHRPENEKAQNLRKNNLCANTAEPPKVVTVEDFAELQKQVDGLPDFRYGNPHSGGYGPPDNRNRLENLDSLSNGKRLEEGDYVTFVGYMIETHYSPKSSSDSGESVNCYYSDKPNVDIHVALSPTYFTIDKHESAVQRAAMLCHTISAEFIPHYRPQDWEKDSLDAIADHPVKISGQLFFDGSHKPCNGNIPAGQGEPRRLASWEIHPIYSISVCRNTDAASCRMNDSSVWLTMRQALSTQPAEEDDQ